VNDKLFRVRFVDSAGSARRAGAAPAVRPAPKKGGVTRASSAGAGNDVVAPMHGVVVEISIAPVRP